MEPMWNYQDTRWMTMMLTWMKVRRRRTQQEQAPVARERHMRYRKLLKHANADFEGCVKERRVAKSRQAFAVVSHSPAKADSGNGLLCN